MTFTIDDILENGSIQKGFTEDPYFMMLNEAAQDPELSAQAKGVLVTLLSLPGNWKIRKKDLHQHHTNGRDAIIKAFEELIAATYVLTIETPGGKGRFPNINYRVFRKRMGAEAQKQLQALAEQKYGAVTKPQPNKKAATDPEPLQDPKPEPKPAATAPVEIQPAAAPAPVDPKPEPKKDDDKIPYKEIIEYLNQKAGKRFRNTKTNQDFIRPRWNEGFRLDDFKTVIDNQVVEWKGQTFSDGRDAEKYLCPETLFGRKFEKYLNNTPGKAKPQRSRYIRDESTFITQDNDPRNHKDDRFYTDPNGRVWDKENEDDQRELEEMRQELLKKLGVVKKAQ